MLWFRFTTKAALVAQQGLFTAEQQSTASRPSLFLILPLQWAGWEWAVGRGTGGRLLSSVQTIISCHLAGHLAIKSGSNISNEAISRGLGGYQLGDERFLLCRSGWVEFFVPFHLLKSQLTH